MSGKFGNSGFEVFGKLEKTVKNFCPENSEIPVLEKPDKICPENSTFSEIPKPDFSDKQQILSGKFFSDKPDFDKNHLTDSPISRTKAKLSEKSSESCPENSEIPVHDNDNDNDNIPEFFGDAKNPGGEPNGSQKTISLEELEKMGCKFDKVGKSMVRIRDTGAVLRLKPMEWNKVF